MFVRRKSMYMRICGSFKTAIHKKSGSTNRKSAKCQICGRFANLTNYLRLQNCEICDLRNFIFRPPSFGNQAPKALSKL